MCGKHEQRGLRQARALAQGRQKSWTVIGRHARQRAAQIGGRLLNEGVGRLPAQGLGYDRSAKRPLPFPGRESPRSRKHAMAATERRRSHVQ